MRSAAVRVATAASARCFANLRREAAWTAVAAFSVARCSLISLRVLRARSDDCSVVAADTVSFFSSAFAVFAFFPKRPRKPAWTFTAACSNGAATMSSAPAGAAAGADAGVAALASTLPPPPSPPTDA